ncbi:heptaprenylglyceryl phosphate synthase [Salinicoccus halitifaciens]|uniref:Glycerol-1-phosphate prenyltransferase n=1 Tax=Salinicoccus halitifaciens TaxID=1073415 RepID=A0ABV2EB77_9STAP|nr:heptaprenylglyceryl phosphate synthase [Salinicoccus halitifaciens]MCD2137479.1 heptaprenylglyceryl phosphate synthase [Salinicoccus halitifaciens]
MLKNARHIFKLDPAREITDEALEMIAESKTDMILVGGTDNVTEDNVLNALSRVRRFSKPVALEVTDKDAVMPGFDHYFIPAVFNTTDIKWQHGLMLEALEEYSHLIDYSEMSLLPYLIMNEDCKAFKKAEAEPVTMEMLPHYVDMIDKLYKTEYLYIEYSGMYGDPEVMETVKRHAENTHVIYGGGITSKEQALEMAQFADTIVAGNVIHDDVKKALRTIIN